MNKKLKTLVYGAIGVLSALIILIVVLIVNNSRTTTAVNEAQARADSLAIANDQLLLTSEFNQLNADFNQYEGAADISEERLSGTEVQRGAHEGGRSYQGT